VPVDAGPTQEIFRLAVEASPSGMIAVNGDGAIIMINGEIERLFGYAREELLGRPVDILLPDEVRAKRAVQRSGYTLRPGTRRMGIGREFLGRRKDGGQFSIRSAVLVATNFIVGRCTASAIASASRKSFFCPFEYGRTYFAGIRRASWPNALSLRLR